MSRQWQTDKQWSDRFLTEVKRTLGEYLIGEPPVVEDQERNTDLVVLKMQAVRIACRIRTASYYQRYGDEFTIRRSRPSGAKTELAKLIEGWGDYLFYGFSTEDADALQAWTLADLSVFRGWYARELYRGNKPGESRNNHDNSSGFFAFKWSDLPPEFVIGSNRPSGQESPLAPTE